MFYCTDTYCRIHKINLHEKYADAYIGTSEKRENPNTSETEYINSGWNARCVGKAFQQISKMEEGTSAKIAKCKITNELYKTKDDETRTFLRVVIFEFASNDMSEPKSKSAKNTDKSSKSKSKKTKKEEVTVGQAADAVGTDDDLPF